MHVALPMHDSAQARKQASPTKALPTVRSERSSSLQGVGSLGGELMELWGAAGRWYIAGWE